MILVSAFRLSLPLTPCLTTRPTRRHLIGGYEEDCTYGLSSDDSRSEADREAGGTISSASPVSSVAPFWNRRKVLATMMLTGCTTAIAISPTHAARDSNQS